MTGALMLLSGSGARGGLVIGVNDDDRESGSAEGDRAGELGAISGVVGGSCNQPVNR